MKSHLRFLEPRRTAVAGTRCEHMTVRAATGRVLGHLLGFVVEPTARRVHYLAVGGPALQGAAILLPINAVRIDMERRTIEVLDPNALQRARPFRPGRFPMFSDEDMLAAMFRRRAAA